MGNSAEPQKQRFPEADTGLECQRIATQRAPQNEEQRKGDNHHRIRRKAYIGRPRAGRHLAHIVGDHMHDQRQRDGYEKEDDRKNQSALALHKRKRLKPGNTQGKRLHPDKFSVAAPRPPQHPLDGCSNSSQEKPCGTIKTIIR